MARQASVAFDGRRNDTPDARARQATTPIAAASGSQAGSPRGHPANQAAKVSAMRARTPGSTAACGGTGLTDGLQLLEQRVAGLGAFEDRRRARDLRHRLLDRLEPAARLEVRLCLQVVLGDDALADGSEGRLAHVAHA